MRSRANAVRAISALVQVAMESDEISGSFDIVVLYRRPGLLRFQASKGILVASRPIFDLTFTRFSKMSDAGKDASLRAWMTSRLGLRRRAFYALRNLSYLGYYSQDATWGLIGYQGPLLGSGEAPA